MDEYLNVHNINDHLCDDCKIVKMKRKSHNQETPKANEILEVIHSDIIGPINDSYTGKRYIITFIDEKSHKSWIYLMRKKSEAIDIIIKFINQLNNTFDGKNVKIFKSDNAKEYKNKKIIEFCEEKGIRKVYSPPYSPENNGIAERFNQTLISCAKTLLFWSKLSENFWDYAVMYANYLYNKTPHQVSKNNIPDESFYGQKVKINHIRTFGCITYYKIYDQNKGKFQSNSRRGIFLGFDEFSHSYLIMDYKNYKIYNSVEIICLEDVPADISLSNKASNNNEYPPFYKFDFNFSKYQEINNNFNPNKFSEDLEIIPHDINESLQNNSNSNHTNIFISSGGEVNKNSKDMDKTKEKDKLAEDEEEEEFYSADEEDFENFPNENNEKIFNNKNMSNFGSKNEESNFSENNNNLSSENLNNNNQINNNLSSPSSNSDNNNNNLGSNNLTLKNQNHNKLSSNGSSNNTNDSILINSNIIPNSESIKYGQTLNNNKNTINMNNNINENYMDNIPSSSNANILNESNSNGNTNNNTFQSNVHISKDITPREEVRREVIVNKSSPKRSPIRRRGRKTLIINDNESNVSQDIQIIRQALQRPKPPNKNPFNKPNISVVSKKRKRSIGENSNENLNEKDKQFYERPNKVHKGLKKRNNKYIANIITDSPLTYNDAINRRDHKEWEKAIKDELENLYNNKIFTLVDHVPKGKNLITTKWVFTNKRDAENNIIKRKARVVARGFKQKKGIDFELTYSPTLNIDALKLIISLSSSLNWDIMQLDIKAAYLNAKLDTDIYITIPPGDPYFGRGYWKLNKALYGLRQSGRQWNITITDFLIEKGYKQLTSEKCIFGKFKNNRLTSIIGLYVDDMVITGEKEEIKNIIKKIKNNFKISKAEPINYILGIKVEKEDNKYYISQTGFIEKLLKSFNIQYTRKTYTPCVGDNTKSENDKPFNITTYKSAIGSLIYLSKCTRPDIAFAVSKAARNSEKPTISDWIKVTHILKYLNTTKHYKICYDGKGEILGYTDSDFAGDTKDRKSTSGNIILMGNSPICWTSKKQSIVATSTAEAEYVSTSECVKKVLWIRNILIELFNYNKPIKIYTDNVASKTNIENDEINPKLKHIAIKYFFNKDNIQKGKIKLEYIDTKNMLADIFTKYVNGPAMTKFANKVFTT